MSHNPSLPDQSSALLTRAALIAIEDTGDFDPVHDQAGAAVRFASAFLAAQDRDTVAARLAEAWCGKERYVGDLTGEDWERWYRVVDAVLGADAFDQLRVSEEDR